KIFICNCKIFVHLSKIKLLTWLLICIIVIFILVKAGDETTEILLTEAEVEALKNLMLEYIDGLEAELLGRDVMSAADEVETSTLTLQTHLDETDPANHQPL
ncbi:hypothetical protein AOLI_G00037850, partial [Acnodon oligacanthus]